MAEAILYIASALYFLYPVAFAALKKQKRPVLVGVTAHGVNIAVLVLCIAIYSPVYFWLLFVAPMLDNLDYLRNIQWILDGVRLVQENGYVIWLVSGLITPYILCKRTFRNLSPKPELVEHA